MGHQTHDLWCDAIVPGDVLDWNGRPRKVRAVVRYDDDCLYSLEFLKVARSAYPCPTVIYYRSEVLANSRGLIGHASLCTVPLECAVQRQIDARISGNACVIRQEDVVGVLS